LLSVYFAEFLSFARLRPKRYEAGCDLTACQAERQNA
jgi:hypothetical protein